VADHSDLELDGPNPWKTLDTQVVWEDSYYRVRQDDAIQPDGRRTVYSYIEAREFAVVVPITDQRTTFMVRQWRYTWGRNSWELPAGICETGEAPADTAVRELAEETGLIAASWTSLGISYNSAAFNKPYHIYLAEGLSPTLEGNHRDGSERDMIVREVPYEQAMEAAANGTILHAPTVTALVRAQHALARR
jgi:8-oxo-dGTP pyrophosphatase MutT (NUDIX family)